ncbi:sensor histidine kinase [Clostridium formicaceticum]|uniref:histidine kinase n=1 Tax=Clostridium formicaceticum TaxID=1497 RepID=A0AAC9RLY7_9CLOT|nr:HAMP domain-containing sensor histidine kinase [Clostridium formicaceticum]AOY77505.1 histidine kinase [Clostridium formicaceticum]ARE88072.1 Sensor histidine kinase TodS [Clostridium formicaceticum]
MKTEFFSNISHELRTPLNVILGSVQLIETYSKDSAYCENQGRVIKNVTIMKQNCYRLLRLVNNLIDITKIDALAFEVHLKNCDIVRIVEEITLSVSNYIENKGIHLIFDTDIEEKIVACDDEKIERIMLNLLSNAVKFTPKEGTILVNIHHDKDHLYIDVKDSGKGIPPEKLQEVFERLCQVTDLFSRHHEGSGIGLSLVKALVEMHGGKISAESELEKGSTFTIQLPTRVVEENWQLNPPAKQDHVERINVEFSDIYSVG